MDKAKKWIVPVVIALIVPGGLIALGIVAVRMCCTQSTSDDECQQENSNDS